VDKIRKSFHRGEDVPQLVDEEDHETNIHRALLSLGQVSVSQQIWEYPLGEGIVLRAVSRIDRSFPEFEGEYVLYVAPERPWPLDSAYFPEAAIRWPIPEQVAQAIHRIG
jgi:hypothetical protein